MIRADLHIHTIYSGDASNQPKAVVEQLNAHPYIKAVAITDHNTLEGYQKTRGLASAYKDLLIIPGVEISSAEGELIILGITELPPKPWRTEKVIEFTRANDAVVIAAHPYRGYGLGELIRSLDVDAVEILNGITSSDLNEKAAELAQAKGIPGVAGSDAHENKDLWTVFNEIKASLDVDEILKAIKKGQIKPGLTTKSVRLK